MKQQLQLDPDVVNACEALMAGQNRNPQFEAFFEAGSNGLQFVADSNEANEKALQEINRLKAIGINWELFERSRTLVGYWVRLAAKRYLPKAIAWKRKSLRSTQTTT